MQHALRAIESSNRARESLDNVVRLLVEEENTDEAPDDGSQRGLPTTVASTSTAAPRTPTIPPPPFPMTGEVFARTVRRRFEEATQESQRAICRDLVRKGLENGVITEQIAAALEEEFK